jgi:hypothetical protein
LLAALLGGYWLLPISGQVMVLPEEGIEVLTWPQMHLALPAPPPGQPATLWVTDVEPWAYMALTVNGEPATLKSWRQNPGGTWTWEWRFTMPDAGQSILVFYHDCHTGCVERGRLVIGQATPMLPAPRLPTKLGIAFPNPQRDWHGRSGWVVDLTYARLADEEYWGIDDLAVRVHQATTKGLRVLVRVDYDRGQSLPPAGDHLALTEYLDYLRRLARDARLQEVYGYLLGSGYNALDSNSQVPDRPVTPAWYARVFNGYGEPVTHTDNAVQVMRAENSRVRVLVGPVRPWVRDQDGERRYTIDAPWLNYMNTLVAYLDEAAQAKAQAGVPLAMPDGFALQVPGRPDAPELAGRDPAQEPRLDLRREAWKGAQAGFRLYRDWLDIINAYPTTRGRPAYITSTNTYAPDEGIPPAQNYPPGWLTTALEVINEEPQVLALCWFLDDIPGDVQWQWFNLTRRPGRLIYAAEEFEALLEP